jgi:RNA polymerase sigma-70 factor (ECF subfamily)
MDESNALLAKQIGQHDPTAFATLFARYYSLVFNVCLRMLRHRQDAEDVTQETFSRVAKYLHRWDSRKPIEPWLIAIAGNRCRTHLSRKKSFQPLSSTAEPATDRSNQVRDAETLREEVNLALMTLPENQQRAFQLFHEQSLNYAEIADRLDCPVGTVKTWVHRARMKLIEQLRQRDVLPERRQTCEADK